MARSTMARLVVLAWFGHASGCNAVLGLERAERIEPPDAVHSGSSANITTCTRAPDPEPSQTCAARTQCQGEREDCLADSSCRYQLGRYRRCLGADCKDEGKACIDHWGMRPDNLITGDMHFCAEHFDQTGCRRPVASACEVYCACMMRNCASVQKVWESEQDCLSQCAGTGDDLVECLTLHCEGAVNSPEDPDSVELHCNHALRNKHADPCGPSTPTRVMCLDKVGEGGLCSNSSACCDGLICTDMVCVK